MTDLKDEVCEKPVEVEGENDKGDDKEEIKKEEETKGEEKKEEEEGKGDAKTEEGDEKNETAIKEKSKLGFLKDRIHLKMPSVPNILKKGSKDKAKDSGQPSEKLEEVNEKAEEAPESNGEKSKSSRLHMPHLAMPKVPKILENIKISNPFTKKDNKEDKEKGDDNGETKEVKEGDEKDVEKSKEANGTTPVKKATTGATLLQSLRVPVTTISGLFARKTKETKEKDAESGDAGVELLEGKESDVSADKGSRKSSSTVTTPATTLAGGELPPPKQTWLEITRERANFIIDDARQFRTWPRRKKYIIGGSLALLLFLLILYIIVCSLWPKPNYTAKIIDGRYIRAVTSCGYAEGLYENDSFAFRGIPYSLPPMGLNRWKAAQTPFLLSHCWEGVLKAHNKSSSCWQFYGDGSYDGNEDCLTVDIYTPRVSYDSPMPVVVYVGGHSLQGDESRHLEPTAALAKKKGVVFVVVNIRRSILGFLALDILSKNSYPYTSGNYGLSDLIEALKWVKFNIEHFGGDPRAITYLGYRSGATLGLALSSSRSAKGLVHQMWLTSGSARIANVSLLQSHQTNEMYLEKVQCRDLRCLYGRSSEELLEAVPYAWRSFTWDLPNKDEAKHNWLILDGKYLNALPEDVWTNKQQNDVAMVIGSMAQVEASPEMYQYMDWSTDQYSTYVEGKLGTFDAGLPLEAMRRYKRTTGMNQWIQFASMVSDIRTTCPLYNLAKKAAGDFKKHVYFYIANMKKQGPMGEISSSGLDVSAIFGTLLPQNQAQQLFIRNMQDLFFGFVWNGRLKNSERMPNNVYLVDDSIQTTTNYPICDFWQGLGFFPRYSKAE